MAYPPAQILTYGLVPGDVKQVGQSKFRKNERGFHVGRVQYLVYLDPPTTKVHDVLARGSTHPKGTGGSPDMDYIRLFITESEWTECDESGLIFEVDVTYKGFFGDPPGDGQPTSQAAGMQGYVRRVTTQSGQFSGENITSPAGTGKHVVGEPSVRAQYSYIMTNASPDTSKINTAITPPSAPSTPANQWTYLSDYILKYPNGWVLDGREYDEVLNDSGSEELYFVTDTYGYYQAFRPGDI